MLSGFEKDRSKMSKELRKDLAKYVAGIVKETGQLMREYGSEMAQAKKAWSGMSGTLAKARKAGFAKPTVEAGEKVTTVKQATRKAQGKKKTSPKSEDSGKKVGVGV